MPRLVAYTALSCRDNGPGSSFVDRQGFGFVGNCKHCRALTARTLPKWLIGASVRWLSTGSVPTATRPWPRVTWSRAQLKAASDTA